jgi:biopolymer transport protein ExbD
MNFNGGARQPEPDELFQITPMVDMVFTLLAFFIMATSIGPQERDFGLGYQEAQLAPGAEAGDFPIVVPIELRAQDEGVAITVGRARLANNDFDAVRAKLTQINMPALSVVVMAEPGLTVEQVAAAVDAVLKSPMRRVSVAPLGGATSEPD